MSKRAKIRRRRHYYVVKNICQSCRAPDAIYCYLPEPPRCSGPEYRLRERPPDEVLCAECAVAAGYCRSCGDFWAGITSFDFIHPGLCDHCHDQIRQDCDEAGDEYEEMPEYSGYEDDYT